MYRIKLARSFKKSYRRCQRRGYDMTLLDDVIEMLRKGETLPEKYHDHMLKGSFDGFHECHIRPSWLLIYLVEDDIVTMTMIDTGSHAELFQM